MKFIHTSDWHLGYYFSSFSSEQNLELENARYIAIESIFKYANKNNIPLIITAGDQFENGLITEIYHLKKMIDIFNKYSHIKVLMIAGNHDYITAGCIYNKTSRDTYPDNLIFADQKEQVIDFKELGIRIYASSLFEKNGRYNPLKWIPEEKTDLIKIAVGHGSIAIEGNHNPDDFPIELNFAKKLKLDYLALGHWHSFYKYDDHSYFSGIPEPLQFKNQGYALEVEIFSGETPRVKELENISQFIWDEETVAFDDSNYSNLMNKLLKSESKKTIKKINFEGYLSIENFNKFIQELKNFENNYYKLFIENSVKIKPAINDIKNILDSSYIQATLDRIMEYKKDSQLPFITEYDILSDEILDKALLKIYDFYKNAE